MKRRVPHAFHSSEHKFCWVSPADPDCDILPGERLRTLLGSPECAFVSRYTHLSIRLRSTSKSRRCRRSPIPVGGIDRVRSQRSEKVGITAREPDRVFLRQRPSARRSTTLMVLQAVLDASSSRPVNLNRSPADSSTRSASTAGCSRRRGRSRCPPCWPGRGPLPGVEVDFLLEVPAASVENQPSCRPAGRPQVASLRRYRRRRSRRESEHAVVGRQDYTSTSPSTVRVDDSADAAVERVVGVELPPPERCRRRSCG